MDLSKGREGCWEPFQLKLIGSLPLEDLREGPVRVTYPPYDVVVVSLNGEVFALEDACNHAGASLAEGDVENACISCPMHGYLFSLRTGELVAPKGLCGPQRTYRVEHRESEVFLWDDEPVQLIGV